MKIKAVIGRTWIIHYEWLHRANGPGGLLQILFIHYHYFTNITDFDLF